MDSSQNVRAQLREQWARSESMGASTARSKVLERGSQTRPERLHIESASSVLLIPYYALSAMGKKAAKSTRKFAASGQLKKTIQARRKFRDIKKKAEKR